MSDAQVFGFIMLAVFTAIGSMPFVGRSLGWGGE